MEAQKTEKDVWDHTKELLGHYSVAFRPNAKFNFATDPKELSFLLSRCKFAMKMACWGRSVLELGCEQGAGAAILGEMATSYTGVDRDLAAIETARQNHPAAKFTFHHADWLGSAWGEFETVVSFDLFAQLKKTEKALFLKGVADHLVQEGIAVIGTPRPAELAEELTFLLQRHFHQVLPFCMSGEIVHTGALEHSEYFLCLCCHKK